MAWSGGGGGRVPAARGGDGDDYGAFRHRRSGDGGGGAAAVDRESDASAAAAAAVGDVRGVLGVCIWGVAVAEVQCHKSKGETLYVNISGSEFHATHTKSTFNNSLSMSLATSKNKIKKRKIA